MRDVFGRQDDSDEEDDLDEEDEEDDMSEDGESEQEVQEQGGSSGGGGAATTAATTTSHEEQQPSPTEEGPSPPSAKGRSRGPAAGTEALGPHDLATVNFIVADWVTGGGWLGLVVFRAVCCAETSLRSGLTL